MITVNTRLLQKRQENRQLLHQNSGIAIMRIFLTHCQFVFDRHIGKSLSDGCNTLTGKFGPVGRTCAVGVGSMIEYGGTEASAHPVSMNLNHVKAGFSGQNRRISKGCGNLSYFRFRYPGNIRACPLIHQLAQPVRRNSLHQHSGHVAQHSFYIGIRNM